MLNLRGSHSFENLLNYASQLSLMNKGGMLLSALIVSINIEHKGGIVFDISLRSNEILADIHVFFSFILKEENP